MTTTTNRFRAVGVATAILVLSIGGPAGASVPPAEPLPLVLAGSWRGEFFANRDLSGTPVATDLGADLALSLWIPRDKEPAPGVPAGAWSLRATAKLRCERAGTWFLGVGGDDGFRVVVDGKLLVDRWKPQAMTFDGARVRLDKGDHSVVLELFEAGGGAGLRFLPEADGEATPPDRWRAEIYAGTEIAGTPLRVQDWGGGGIDFDWGYGSPSLVVPPDDFCVRAERTVAIATRGYHTFVFRADDHLRFFVDGKLVLDQWNEYDPRDRFVTPWLEAGMRRVRIEYRERGGGARLSCSWRPLGVPEASLSVMRGRVRLPEGMAADRDVPVRVTLATERKDAFYVDLAIARGKREVEYSIKYPPQDSIAILSYRTDDPRFLRRGFYLEGVGTNHDENENFRLVPGGMLGMDLELIKPAIVKGRISLPAGTKLDRDLALTVQAFSPGNTEFSGHVDARIPAGASGVDYEVRAQAWREDPRFVLAVHCYEGGFVRHSFWDGKGLVASWSKALLFDPDRAGSASVYLALPPDASARPIGEERAALPEAIALEARKIAKDGYTEFEKALALYEHVCAKTRYASMPEYYFSESYCALLPFAAGVGVCSGYGHYLVLLLKGVGIEARQVGGAGHSWLQARIGGAWYHLDPTKSDEGERADYRHFLESDEQVSRNAGNSWDRDYAEPCPRPYPFDAARDMPSLKSRADGDYKRVFGTLAMPAGRKASAPFFVYVNGYRFLFPADSERIFFGVAVPRKSGADFPLKVAIEANDQGLLGGFWDGAALATSESAARRLPTAGPDLAGISVALGSGLSISGELSLPAGVVAPKGGWHAMLNVYDCSGKPTQWSRIEFREGGSAAPFSFSLVPGAYALGLNGGDGAFPKQGYFADGGMTPHLERAKRFALDASSIAGLMLALESGLPLEGTLSLPAGMTGQKGGSGFWIDVFDSSLRKLYWHRVVVKEGEGSAPFSIRTSPGWYYLRVSSNDPRCYAYQNVGRGAVAWDFADTWMLESGSAEARSISILLAPATRISGTVALAGGRKAGAGGMELELLVLLPSGKRVASRTLAIKEGETGAPFDFDLMAGSYLLGYRTKGSPATTAWYAGAKSHPDWRRALPVDAAKEVAGIVLVVE